MNFGIDTTTSHLANPIAQHELALIVKNAISGPTQLLATVRKWQAAPTTHPWREAVLGAIDEALHTAYLERAK